jgi:Uma2 family endonuclease
LANWARKDGTGRAFDSSTNFNLPSGAKRSPDAAWVPRETLQKEGKATRSIAKTRHVPTFLTEVTSPSDSLNQQQEKCRNWIESGVSEAILLHPETKTAYISRPGEMVTVPALPRFDLPVLKGFEIDCGPIWEEL